MNLSKEQLLLMVQTFGQTLITLGFEKFEVITVSENARFGSSEDPRKLDLGKYVGVSEQFVNSDEFKKELISNFTYSRADVNQIKVIRVG